MLFEEVLALRVLRVDAVHWEVACTREGVGDPLQHVDPPEVARVSERVNGAGYYVGWCLTDLEKTANLALTLTIPCVRSILTLPRPECLFLLWFLVEDVAVVGANLIRIAKLA